MTKLTAKARSKIPSKDFAGPGRSFPIEDKNHARAALSDLPRAKGLSAAAKEQIARKARAKLMTGK